MRTPSRKILTETFAALERVDELWVDEDEFAGIVQRLQGVNGLPFEWTKGVLELGVLQFEGHGTVRRFASEGQSG